MGAKVVFLSYSHDSEAHRKRVLALSERLREDGLETILDQYVNGTPKQGWPRWMPDQLDEADRVLVVCTETYYRRFRGHEEPGKGKGADWEGAIITQAIYDAHSRTTKFVPVLFDAKDEPFIPEPLRGQTWYLVKSKSAYDELYDALLEQAGVEPGAIGTPKAKARKKGEALRFEEDRGDEARRIHPTRISRMPAKLFGREEELARLDAAWADPQTHVVILVAWGGEGKTSLIGKWAARLAARDYDGARYFDWTFYSQGTSEDRSASSDTFLAAALRFFGDPGMADSPAAPEEKGRRVAELVARERILLLLDGVEPLQYPPGPAVGGEFKDRGIKALLRGLAQSNKGLCLVTSRETVKDLAGFCETTAPEWTLGSLSTVAGVELLRSLGVQGNQVDLETLVKDVDGHALTLNLIGTYLARAHGGDVRKRDRIDLHKADRALQGGHAFKAMAAYEQWFNERGEEGARQLAILRLMGLFDRPATGGCLGALREAPTIPGLTEPLFDLTEEDWNLACSALRECHLLAPAPPVHSRSGAFSNNEPLDAHPILREYFARRLRDQQPEAWQTAHSRIYEYLRDKTEYQPDTLEGLQRLYQAVTHGCQAKREQETCDTIYQTRILRGQEFYSTKKLGAFGIDLGALVAFFEAPWSRASSALAETDQAWLFAVAAFDLRALGRLEEALQPLQIGRDMRIALKDWENAAISAGNLSELELTLGDMDGALRAAEQSVTLADRSQDPFQRMSKRTLQAEALYQTGQSSRALEIFQEAERMQIDREPEYPLLYSVQGYSYCDLLLAGAERAAWRGMTNVSALQGREIGAREVEERASTLLGWRNLVNWNSTHDSQLDLGLDHLTLGRARLYRSILEKAGATVAISEIEQAVNGLRTAGQQQYLASGLLTRAWLRSLEGNPSRAQADLDEAQEIAERGPMPLYLADIALYRARLFRDREALATARVLIERHGYWRRKEELADAEEAAEGWNRPPKTRSGKVHPGKKRKAKTPSEAR